MSVSRDDLRALDALLLGNEYPDEVLDALLPHVEQNLELAGKLRTLALGEVPNALVLAAGGRK